MNEKIFTLGFAAFPGIGTLKFEKLITVFGSPQNAWQANPEEVEKVIGKILTEKFIIFRRTFYPEKYAQELEQKCIHFFVPSDKAYPSLLNKLPHPPFILFAKGNVSLLKEQKSIAIVGTRKITSYGREVTEMITRDLAAQGFVIVSGMACGVDSVAHRETLKNNGKTIAVLGSGVDVPTPSEHTHLYKEILEQNGLIVSTFFPGQKASVGSFPARNAIIAGLSLGVVVTEAAADSGSLITARDAKKFGRKVFTIPGQITSYLSKGTNNLIQQGAIAIGNAAEILDTLGIMKTQKVPVSSARKKTTTSQEEQIITLLKNGPLHFDEIARTIGKDSKSLGVILTFMELKGVIKNIEGIYSV